MLVVVCNICFFFFKQKTAYELRISDWSSDVCSSDLGAYQPVIAHIGFIQGSVVQITSDDPNVINEDIRIDRLDLDGSRIANSTPNNPHHPAINAIAPRINRVASADIRERRVTNYPHYTVQLFDCWRTVRYGKPVFPNRNTFETT